MQGLYIRVLGVFKSMKKVLPLLSIIIMFGCANTVNLNDRIYEVQKQELIASPYESAQYATEEIERQRRFRQTGIPQLVKEKIFTQSITDTIIVIEEFDEICFNCTASSMMVLRQDTIYIINREIEKGNTATYKTHKEPYRTVSLGNEYIANYHQFLVINKKLKNREDWAANSGWLGSDTCSGGGYTLATVVFPNQEVESMFVRCWWLGSSRKYLEE